MFKLLLLIVMCVFSLNANCQDIKREGNTFSIEKVERVKEQPIKTKFVWKDNKDREYPIYISKRGSCFIYKTSKEGKVYKQYLPKEVSKEIKEILNNK